MPDNLLTIKNLTISVQDIDKERTIVEAANFSLKTNSVSALVGGSGSGKTTIALSILRLLPLGLKVKNGGIYYGQQDILSLDENRMRNIRGKEIGMVFQEPLSAFNPVFTLGYQIKEVLEAHTDIVSAKKQERIYEILRTVGIDEPKRIAESYPHQLSGGLRQRVMIAQAIAANPKLIIADEPTSNLDVTLQAKVIDLFLKLKEKLNLSIILISHDLGLVAHVCDEMTVIHNGVIIEQGKTKEVIGTPRNKYTHELIKAADL